MAAKREQVLWENVWPVAKRLEASFSLTAILSAGLLLFDELSGDEQKVAIAEANQSEQGKSWQEYAEVLFEKLRADKDIGTTVSREPERKLLIALEGALSKGLTKRKHL